ncbi:MAG: DUF2269 family protein [Chloroflexi bacterium]|nr:DUF2269 family protein [Chloroflexota bacterium]MQC16647.1 DUF2269 family protein [Chloroflexota bacterium]
MTFWRFVHLLGLLYFMAGIGNTVVPIWKAWLAQEIEQKALHLQDAQRNEVFFLLPGLLAVFFSGYAWAAAGGYNVVTTGWLVALQVITFFDLFIFLPLMGVGLRRVHYLALAAKKHGDVTPELRDALADNVPLVFGTLMVLTIPVMVWLAVFKPF